MILCYRHISPIASHPEVQLNTANCQIVSALSEKSRKRFDVIVEFSYYTFVLIYQRIVVVTNELG